MKKILFFFFLILLFSCSKSEIPGKENEGDNEGTGEETEVIPELPVYPSVDMDTVKLPITMPENQVDLISKYEFDKNSAADISTQLQKEINEQSANGGAKIFIAKGDYTIGNVNLASNIHILIEGGTIIRPYGDVISSARIFTVGDNKKDYPTVENVSIQGVGGRFKVILPSQLQSFDTKFVFIGSSGVKNFYYANADIYDNQTIMPTLSFGPIKENSKNIVGATNGVVANMTLYNGHYGYGLVQAQAARNVRFYNLHGVGGITLRLETGSESMNDSQFGGVFDIVGENISIKNGHGAVACWPHGMIDGVCHFKNITAESSGFGVSISSGWDGAGGLGADGRFGDGTSVENVTAIFGFNAQIKTKELFLIPVEYKDKLAKPGQESIIENAPAHTCVIFQTDIDLVYDKSTFHAYGYKYDNPIRISKSKIENSEKQKMMLNYLKTKYNL